MLCLVISRADCLALAQGPEQTEPLEKVKIDAREVQNSIESFLEAIAINGKEIPPTVYPEARLGDIITFRARIQSTYPGTLRMSLCGADWGKGLTYQGAMTSNYVKCRYDEREQKILADIGKIPGDPARPYTVGQRPASSDCWYTFDLKVADCKNLSVNLYTDELYSCQPEKTYYVAPVYTTPEIHYSVAMSPEKVLSGKTQPVTITITNTGEGAASSLIMETNLNKFFVRISNLSPEFVYDSETGVFIAGREIAPGQSITLNFDLEVFFNNKTALPEDMILFRPLYADNCGLRFKGPETLIWLRPVNKNPETITRGADQGVEISVQLPDVVEENQSQDAVVTITKTDLDIFYDLEVELDTGNYAFAGDLVTTGFDGRTPVVDTADPGRVVFSFDNNPNRAEQLLQGGSLRFKVRKKCAGKTELKASARFVDQMTAFSATLKTPEGQALNMPKNELTVYARPILYRTADLGIRVTPECCRLEPGIPMTWNIYVSNQGAAAAHDVMLADILPENIIPQEINEEKTLAPQIEKDSPSPGQTRLTWTLGDIMPSQTRKVTVAALPLAKKETFGAPVNSIRTFSKDAGDACYQNERTAPCLILPDACLGDVYEKPEKFHAFFSFAHVYESNLYEAYENPTDVWATYITPGLWMALPASHDRLVEIATTSATPGGLAVSPFFPKNDRRYQFYLLYSPQFEFYQNESKNDVITHRVDAYFHYNTLNRLSLQLIDQFKRGHDSVSSRAFSVKDKYKTNLFSTVSNFHLTEKVELRLDYSNFLVNYDDPDNHNDRDDNSWSAYGYFNLTPKISLFGEYEYANLNYHRNYLGSEENRIFGGIRWEFANKTSGQIKGGYGKRHYDLSALGDTGTWMAELVVDYDMTEKTRIVVDAYRRYEEAMGVGLIGEAYSPYWSTHLLTHMAGVAINYDLTKKLHLNLHSTVFFDEYADDYKGSLWDDKKRRDREFAISPKIKCDFLKWLTFDLSYTYTNKTSNYVETEYEDHKVLLRGTLYR